MEVPILVPIHTDKINELWPRILPWAQEFCQHSQESYDPPYILEKLNNAKMQLWLVMNDADIFGIILTEVRMTKIKECVIVVATGEDMESSVHLLKTLEKYALLMGCKKMIGIARPGWERVLKPFGYKKTHVQVEKFL